MFEREAIPSGSASEIAFPPRIANGDLPSAMAGAARPGAARAGVARAGRGPTVGRWPVQEREGGGARSRSEREDDASRTRR
ncbi:hypothetical protein PAHAL_2G054800 [Panicum hallii]|jgi:hypothetical protein|uniref:Uncharacterized protein n=1 Tax=Panicum hallii TaxID=206008 RepID=A0A2T8KN02_9POAL|nr:hypothetical protein PAHAL_2G054800 [Panicum hallii]